MSGPELDFASFVAARGPALLRTATLLCANRHDGEDLLQGALERTYRRWGRVCRGGHPEAYVRRSMVNAMINRRVRSRVLQEVSHDVMEFAVAGLSDELETSSDRHILLRALQSLPTRQRSVLVLRYFEDMTEAEVGDLMGCSRGTVKSQTSRALAKLRADPLLAREFEVEGERRSD